MSSVGRRKHRSVFFVNIQAWTTTCKLLLFCTVIMILLKEIQAWQLRYLFDYRSWYVCLCACQHFLSYKHGRRYEDAWMPLFCMLGDDGINEYGLGHLGTFSFTGAGMSAFALVSIFCEHTSMDDKQRRHEAAWMQ
jgi:hypothetical protein